MSTRNYLKSIILLFMAILVSCSKKEDSPSRNEEPVNFPTAIITSLSSDFLVAGDEITILGNNFEVPGKQTELVINGNNFEIDPVSNEEITLVLTPDLGTGQLRIRVRVDNQTSNEETLFVVPNSWYQIPSTSPNQDIIRSFSFESSNTIISLVDTIEEDNSFYGIVRIMDPSSSGYQNTSISINDALLDLQMHSETTGVAIGSTFGYFTDDRFESNNKFGELNTRLDGKISFVDESSCVLMNSLGEHSFTNNKGQSLEIDPAPDYLARYTTNGIQGSGVVVPNGKSMDGNFYEVGFILDRETNSNYRNLIQRSSTGYNNWEVIDSITPYNGSLAFAKFFDINKIYSKNLDNQFVLSEDLGKTWSSIRDGISNFYLRNDSEYYVVSEQNIFVSKDSGTTWNLELELPIGSKINHMQFSNSKIVVSGNDGLLFVKYE